MQWWRSVGPTNGRALRDVLADRCLLFTVLLLMVTVARYGARLNRFLDLTTHFTALYACAAAPLLTLLLLCRWWRSSALAALVLALNLADVLPWYLPNANPPLAGKPQPLRLFESNVLSSNRETGRLLDCIRATDPDVVVLLEVDRAWAGVLTSLDQRYPHSVCRPRSDNFGIALYSRLPIRDEKVLELTESEVPAIQVTVRVGQSDATVVAVHTLPPGGAEYTDTRNRQLAAIASLATTIDGALIVTGDLNTALWSPHYLDMIRNSGLQNARRGFGILPTWPAMYRPFMVPLDHCLVSRTVRVQECRTGPSIGSDHLPLIVDLDIAS